MPNIYECSEIRDVLIVEPDVFEDERGYFVETYRRSWFPLGREMIQANRGDRKAGCLVGLHYHLHQADFWYIPRGACRIVLHDIRDSSPTYGKTFTVDVGTQADGSFKHLGVFIPPGVAHGFLALTDMTITYMVDNYYNKQDELGIAWDDPAIKADWVFPHPVVSERDKQNPYIDDLKPRWRPKYGSRK